MAETKGPTLNPLDDLRALLYVVVILWLFWYTQGGPAKYNASQKVLLKPSWPIDTGESYGDIPNISIQKRMSLENKPVIFSPSAPMIQRVGLSRGGVNSSSQGYIVLDFSESNNRPMALTGLVLRNILGKSINIGGASNLPLQGAINEESDVILSPGSKVFLVEGGSPIGVSFRVNKCFGYLTQFQEFYPQVKIHCTRLPCAIPRISTFLSYNSCVRAQKNDPDFFSNEWRVYLKNTDKIWNETGDLIRLLDKDGESIASVIY